MKTKKKKECSACGTVTLSHRYLYFSGLLDLIVGRKSLFFSKITENRFFIEIIENNLRRITVLLGIVKYNSDIEKAVSGRSKVIWQEAKRRGIPMKQLVVLGMPVEKYVASLKGKDFVFQSIPIPPWLPHSGYEWIDDKFIFNKKLKEAGISVPETRKIKSSKDLKKIFNELEKPIIIKPISGSMGRHTTTNINTLEDLEQAYRVAKQISPVVIAQEHLFGSIHRATVVNNKLVGFFKADPPSVTGDGIKNIKELIEEKNKNKRERVSDILINEELLNFIKRQNYELESIVPADLKINLLAKTGRFYGGYTKEMLPEIHPKLVKLFEDAARFACVPVVGFDFIILDPTQDPDLQKCGIIEGNSLPFIDLHYFNLEGEPVNIAKYIWDLWE